MNTTIPSDSIRFLSLNFAADLIPCFYNYSKCEISKMKNNEYSRWLSRTIEIWSEVATDC